MKERGRATAGVSFREESNTDEEYGYEMNGQPELGEYQGRGERRTPMTKESPRTTFSSSRFLLREEEGVGAVLGDGTIPSAEGSMCGLRSLWSQEIRGVVALFSHKEVGGVTRGVTLLSRGLLH